MEPVYQPLSAIDPSTSKVGVEPIAPWAAGEITLYRLYDIGYEIDLVKVLELLSESAPERVRPARGEAQAIQIDNPPVTVRLGEKQVDVGGVTRSAQLSARVFDFGVLSLRVSIPVERPSPWSQLAGLVADIGAGEWAPHFQRWREELVTRLAAAIVRPDDSGVSEDYLVIQVQRLQAPDGEAFSVEALTEEHIAGLLFGEQRPLSAIARAELLSPRFSYFEDDLAVMAWNAALIVEPVIDDVDVQYVLEFANAQLLELRYYDTVLDREIPHIYSDIAVARRGIHLFGRRYGRLLAALQSRVADATELVERVENALKVTEDVYLARVYAAALKIFRGRTWRHGIDRKVAIVREAYSMLNDESIGRRSEMLEITIIILIAVDIVLALVH
jgi:hypothetical protein